MELLNATKMIAGYTMGMDPAGRESLVVVVKGTFTIPPAGEKPQLARQQQELIMADTCSCEPGFSSPIYEADYAPVKPRCDVLLHGSAYAPDGRPVSKVTVGLKVGGVAKSFNVVGDRVWEAGITGIGASRPTPFVSMPISYGRAFGGLDNFHKDESKHAAYRPNPVGRGFHKLLGNAFVDGTPLPNSEESNRAVKIPNSNYQAMAFGPIARGWMPRSELAGTYDQNWLDNVFPFLPADFDNAYFQAAPLDQQTAYLQGGEEVVLVNLTSEGRTVFQLPTVDVPIVFFRKKGEKVETQAVLDTLVIEPDRGFFTLTWRASLALKKNMFEIPQVLAGKKPRGWWRARELGKTYYSSLEVLRQSKKRESKEAAE